MADRGSILIVDSNVGFATMLQESLEQDQEYRTIVAHKGTEALEIAYDETFDLAIVDLGIDATDDLDGATVARRLRQGQDDLRLMLIPLEGDVLPEEVADLNVQSVLPKPFFLPDLPELIEDALTQPTVESTGAAQVTERREEPVSKIEPSPAPAADLPEVARVLEELAQEINADAVLLTYEDEILASVGRLSSENLSQLAQIVRESYRASSQIAQVLGRDRGRFQQSTEGGEYLLHSLVVLEDVVLSAALRGDVALGIVRHRCRATAKRLSNLIDSS